MGCAHAQNSNAEAAGEPIVAYSDTEDIEIKEYAVTGVLDDIKSFSVRLTDPKVMKVLSATANSRICSITTCILPGLDPHGAYQKECQDGLVTVQTQFGFLAVLMDGHGNEGERVVALSLAMISSEFPALAPALEETLTDLLRRCDEMVKSHPLVDCSISGSTAVAIYANGKGLHAASVGDSRAVLGVASPKDCSVSVSKRNRHFRCFRSSKPVDSVQLTVDQKPNHVGEMDRIQKAGGRVARIKDDHGKELGPYRVWERFGALPGLAMSRSIGDKLGSRLGVTSTAIYNFFPYYPSVDLFVVIASDGVWDAMANGEVVSFVEKYRKLCPKSSTFTRVRGKVTPQSTSIAHLLCEEARYRWLGICEEEDVMIDDISCIIIELPVEPITPKFDEIPDRSVGRTLSLTEKDDPSEFLRGKHVDSRGTLVENEPQDDVETQTELIAMRVSRKVAESLDKRQSKALAVRNDILRGSIVCDTDPPHPPHPPA